MLNKHTILSSLLWKYLERSGTQFVQFVVSIVLARILAPEEFGLIAIITIFIAIANVFVQSGLNTALIQKKDADDLDFSSVFYASFIMASIVYAVLFFSSPLIANFYNNDRLIPVIRVLALSLFIGAINSIQLAYISRNMMFKKLFIRSIGAIIPSGIIGIILAVCGFGVWALVTQQLTNSLLAVAVMWFTVPWRPKLSFSLQRLKGLFSFGWKLLCSSLLDVCYHNIRGLIIGKIFTPADLAFYNRGEHFPNLVVNNINNSIQSVMLPSLSAIQDNKTKVKGLMRKAIITSSFLIAPMMAILAATAKTLVLVLLGEKWLPCVPFIVIYCFIFCFYPIHTSNLSAINALGRSDIFLKLEIIKKLYGVGLLVASLLYFRTPVGIAIGAALGTLISCFVNAHPNKKLLDYGYLEQIRDILPNLGLSLIAGACVYALGTLDTNIYLLFILQAILGVIVYFGLAKLLHFKCLDYLIQTIKGYYHGR